MAVHKQNAAARSRFLGKTKETGIGYQYLENLPDFQRAKSLRSLKKFTRLLSWKADEETKLLDGFVRPFAFLPKPGRSESERQGLAENQVTQLVSRVIKQAVASIPTRSDALIGHSRLTIGFFHPKIQILLSL
jgi:hypothetical protein